MFDFRFTRFITNSWISFIWTLTVILSILACVGGMAFGVCLVGSIGDYEVIAIMLLTPIVIALFLLFARMGLELIVVIFRIETHLRTIRDKYENK